MSRVWTKLQNSAQVQTEFDHISNVAEPILSKHAILGSAKLKRLKKKKRKKEKNKEDKIETR
jgi:ElaB/YqjD/DUF883 family membrane-anchored ribosome-binding protein